MTEVSPSPSIKTDISEFCQSFAGILKPFASSLETVRSGIQEKGDVAALQRPMAGFADVHHRLESLIHKVEEQQAYLIIFGPLKSGKSTLMNAISAAYVSEVTSLPAYPCLVHVKHGEGTRFVASRYSGEKLQFSDNASLQAEIQDSHEKLAERLREVEEEGGEFDPGVHFPDAIRRVDVAVPTKNLKDSLTVLVDTPGLYTRMKFGYDLMTREFRNAAACAVFVVKTDNLFLEQVFEEFNELLDLFSRIFLVVNIDSNKRDLDPDGSLRPSLESKSPEQVIRAFESLVMSAPLRRAREEGRLKIYPIDLLNSASAAMCGKGSATMKDAAKPAAPAPSATLPPLSGGPPVIPNPFSLPPGVKSDAPAEAKDAEGDDKDAESSEDVEAVEESPALPAEETVADRSDDAFQAFLKDLTDYLNSSDYLQEFMGDALHMGSNLASEVQDHCSSEASAALEEGRKALKTEADENQIRLAAMEKLAALDLKNALAHVGEEVRKHAAEVSKAASVEAQQKALKQLDGWFDNDESVAALEKQWAELVQACARRVSTECHGKVRSLLSGPLGGIRVEEDLRAGVPDLEQLLAPAVSEARATIGDEAPALRSGPFKIEPETLKVRKSIWDWLAFRNLPAVRRRIFGEPDSMDHEVTVMIKDKRLGEEGRQALKERIIGELSRQFPGEAVRVSEALITTYQETLSQKLGTTLQEGRDACATRQAELARRIEDLKAIRQTLDELSTEAAGVLTAVEGLRLKHHTASKVGVTEIEVEAEVDEVASTDLVDERQTDLDDSTDADMPEDSGFSEVEDTEDAVGLGDATPSAEPDAEDDGETPRQAV